MAIEYTTKNREYLNSKLIYPHDVFYRRVSKIDEIFNALFSIENDVTKNNSNEQAINYLIDTTFFFSVSLKFSAFYYLVRVFLNHFLCLFLKKLLKTSQNYRQEKKKLYEQNQNDFNDDCIEFIKWTFLPVNEITASNPSVYRIYKILNNLYKVDSLIFEEYECRLNSIEEQTEYMNLKLSYDSLKTKLIQFYCKILF